MFASVFRMLAAAIIFPPVAVSAEPRHVFVVVKVAANQGWQNVRLRLGGRGMLKFTTQGKWVFNPSQPPVGGGGAGNLSTAGRTNYVFSGPDGREGQLIGKIGDAAPFVAGADGVHKIKRNEIGRLTLTINDDFKRTAGAGLADNSDYLRVRIDYERE